MSMTYISIIMPVYNAEKYIVLSLTSILNQIDSSIEVIVVNDGSTDNSLSLINQYFKSFIESNQLRLITQENHGVSTARNLGIANAKGRYIGFMDADDLALDGYYDVLLKAINTNPDIVEFGYKNFVSSINDLNENSAEYSNTYFGFHQISQIADQVYSKARWYPWTRIFRKELFENVSFPKGVRFCEDLMTIPNLYEKAKTILVLREAIYGYRANANGATAKVENNYVDSLIGFYNTIPNSGLLKHDYLKLSIAYAIFSCKQKLNRAGDMPKQIQNDLDDLRKKCFIYPRIGLRRTLILFYPNIYQTLKKWIH